MANVISGTNGGKHVSGAPLTTTLANEASPALVINDVDRRVARVRPMSSPVDQISRMVGARAARSMVVDYYAVDTKSGEAVIDSLSEVENETYDNRKVYLLTVSSGSLAPTDTLLLAGQSGTSAETGGNVSCALMLYVIKQISAQSFHVIPVNGTLQNGVMGMAPRPGRGTVMIRMGRGAGELDVQTSQFEALPRKQQNYCQIFK